MICSICGEEVRYTFTQLERYEVSFSEDYVWVHHRPRAVVHIDLDQDDCQAIARKLDRWEQIAAREASQLRRC